MGSFFETPIPSTVPVNTEQTLRRIHAMLRKLDALPMPWCLRPRVEAILVRQAAKMMDSALPWQRGHGQRTAELARRIGSCAGMSPESLHHLALAARLHDIGLLALPPALVSHVGCLDDRGTLSDNLIHDWAPNTFNPSDSCERPPSSSHITMNDGMDQDTPTAYEVPTFPSRPVCWRLRTPSMPSRYPGGIDQEARDRAACRILTVGAGTQFDPELVQLCGHCLQQRNLIFSFN